MNTPIFPKPLRPGDKIALVAPASVPNQVAVDRFCNDWRNRGFEITIAESVYDRVGYLAGSDAKRAAELMQAFTDPTVNAIFAVRGGYGTNRMVDLLDFESIREATKSAPKIFAGFSDMTTLHAVFNRHCNLVTFHGPHPNDGLDPDSECLRTAESFYQSVTQPLLGRVLCDDRTELTTIGDGLASGPLVGGNLAVLASTIGTRFCPSFAGSILFLEDIGERPYRIDRYLSQLRLAGHLDEVAGILLGHFTDCEATDAETSQSLEQVFEDYFSELTIPTIRGIPSGHQLPNLTLPLHAKVELDTEKVTVTVVE